MEHARPQEPWRDEQLSEDRRRDVTCDRVEHIRYVCGDVLIGGEQAQVFVRRCIGSVIVAAADVGIPPQPVPLPAHEQAELRVDLRFARPVDDVHTCALQRA